MSILLLGPQEKSDIEAAVARAKAKPIPFTALVETSVMAATIGLRNGGSPRPPSEKITLGHFTCCISFEDQPAGLVRHLSVSVPQAGRLPHPTAVKLLCKEFGFKSFPPVDGTFWLEEFAPGHECVNIVELDT